MASVQDIRLGINLLRHKFFGHRFPAHVAIAVTNKCNLDCSYCYSQKAGKFGQDMTTEQMMALVDELFSMGTRYIVLTGGEPLVRKDIKQLIDYITGKGMKCGMSCNGLLLDRRPEVLENLTSINISLDGNEEQHTRNRGAQDYAKVIGAIRLCVQKGIPVSIGCVLTQANMDCVGFIAKLAKEINSLCYFHIPYWRAEDKGDGTRGYDMCKPMTMEQTSKAMAEIHRYKEEGYPVSYSNRLHAYIRDWPFPTPTVHRKELQEGMAKGFKPIHCMAGDCYCIIDADGSVFPCASMIGQVKALKVPEVGFKKAWDFLPTVRCAACHFFLQNELNLLFSLDPRTWMNLVKTWPHLLRRNRSRPLEKQSA